MLRSLCLVSVMGSLLLVSMSAQAELPSKSVHDLTLLVAPELPSIWPVGMTQHVIVPSRT
ncbi:MAG: hypothetical protein JWN70_3111, partial [Planctomycetaceae bacterium]|nr:hypothetical protein [Planctomycetaceae bacterium]